MGRARVKAAVAVPLALCMMSLVPRTAGLHIYLASGDMFCFYEEVQKDSAIDISYFAETGGENPDPTSHWFNKIHADIKNVETGDIMASQKANHAGRLTFSSHLPGQYQICLKTVSESLWHNPERVKVSLEIVQTSLDLLHYRPHVEITGTFHSNVIGMINNVGKISEEMDMQISRKVLLSLHSKELIKSVRFWAVINILVFFALSIFQIFHLRRLFVSKKIV